MKLRPSIWPFLTLAICMWANRSIRSGLLDSRHSDGWIESPCKLASRRLRWLEDVGGNVFVEILFSQLSCDEISTRHYAFLSALLFEAYRSVAQECGVPSKIAQCKTSLWVGSVAPFRIGRLHWSLIQPRVKCYKFSTRNPS